MPSSFFWLVSKNLNKYKFHSNKGNVRFARRCSVPAGTQTEASRFWNSHRKLSLSKVYVYVFPQLKSIPWTGYYACPTGGINLDSCTEGIQRDDAVGAEFLNPHDDDEFKKYPWCNECGIEHFGMGVKSDYCSECIGTQTPSTSR